MRKTRIKRWIKRFLTMICLLLLAAVGFQKLEERSKTLHFVESYYQIQSDKLSENIRVILLSDLHLREFGENNCDLVNRIEELNPDLIAIVGDMNMDDNPDYHVVTDLCEALVEIAPVYYVPGNHEWPQMVFETSNLKQDLIDTGVHLLTDLADIVEVNGNTIKIGGLAEAPEHFAKYATDFFESFEEGDLFKLLLTHYPEYFEDILKDAEIDVAMCGHAHGGQVRIPGIGGLYTKDQGWFPKLTEGVVSVGDVSVVISRGLGDSSDVPRINNPPELVIVDMNWY
jgi:predicted MPP superfamily phosphohydrolase